MDNPTQRRSGTQADRMAEPAVSGVGSGGARAWIDQHLYSLVSSLGRLWQRRGATLLTILVMALTLALPLLLEVAVRNLTRFSGALHDTREISAFLDVDADDRTQQETQTRIAALDGVGEVLARTPADGIEELRQLAGFAKALDVLDENPLPTVLRVSPASSLDAVAIKALAARIEAIDGVDFVQYDLVWRERLDLTLALATRVIWLIGALLALGALLVVGNTIRLDVAGRAEEIAIVQLLGGTNGFVRRPFLYAGVWYGALAAGLAVLGAMFAVWMLRGPVRALALSYGSDFALASLTWPLALGTLGAGIVLGWLGAFVASGRELAKGKPS
jgi:cell division transport system permease protein